MAVIAPNTGELVSLPTKVARSSLRGTRDKHSQPLSSTINHISASIEVLSIWPHDWLNQGGSDVIFALYYGCDEGKVGHTSLCLRLLLAVEQRILVGSVG